ncbi:MAG: hypothetical protein PHX70_09950 [Clostridium sp.]|nr:hypothetical protein [Clostridium sp.]
MKTGGHFLVPLVSIYVEVNGNAVAIKERNFKNKVINYRGV